MRRWIPCLLVWSVLLIMEPAVSAQQSNPRDTGYRGIWFTLGQQGEYGDKYSGGLGTYTANHRPLAIYSKEANKTFFVYGGAKEGKRHLLIMASYYDHATGMVPKPVIVHDKLGVDDPHDNASIAMDGDGHVWVFVSGRGQKRPGFKFRSREPYSIDSFEQISEEEMTYPQPWWIPGEGFIHMFTKYTAGRELYWNTSPDGRSWSPPHKLAGMGGHYQISTPVKGGVASAFNYHPGGSVDKRTNIYYVRTDDMGETWHCADGTPVQTPLTDTASPALVHDYAAENLLVYLCDLAFDQEGKPIILYVTSHHHMPGPEGDPRAWCVSRWDGKKWGITKVTAAHHNYDTGQLWLESGQPWRIYAPTAVGASKWGAGGEVVLWESQGAGFSWTELKRLTSKSALTHNYVRRPVDAHRDFYAFWADANPESESVSRLYFCNCDGDKVWRLPYDMEGEWAAPELVSTQD